MGKKAVKPKHISRRKEAKPNLFEHIYNKKKFNVLGKKQKGEQKHGKARADAVDKRKKTLLVEYKELQKSNAFVDRRFGEDDSSLTEEEKALARFQRQRMKELTGTKFSLPDHDEEDELTHMGRALADDDIKAVGRPDLDDEDEGGLDDAIVRDFHFGGGFVPKQRVEGEEDKEAGEQVPERRKSKKEVMEELIAKSKAFKAAKSQQRDEDLEATEALDTKLASLLESGSLAGLVKPKGARHERKAAERDAPPQRGDDTEFDKFRRELVFEAKGQVSERTKTAEELAELERQRLEALEVRRQKRMRAGADEADDLDGEGDVAPSGGYKARRQKQQKRLQVADYGPSGDALEDEFQLSGEDEDEGFGSEEEDEDEEPVSKLDARRKARAAGDDELQMQFKAESAALLEKYGIKASDEGDGEGDSDEEGSGSEEDSEGTDADEESEESGGSGLEDDDEDESYEAEADTEEQEGEEGAGGQALQQPDEGREGPSKRVDSGRAATTSEGAGDAAAGQLPFTLEAPSSYEEFATLVAGRPAEELSMAIQRIRICNAVALASGNRKKMQVFYGILVQHFAMLAGSVPLPMDHLDALTVHLLDITGEVPFYAATVARARLSRLQQRLATALTNPESYGDGGSAWPGTRAVLLLKLWSTLFPVSDRRHPVTTPAALLVSAHLALCPISRASDIPQGLFLSALALHMAAPASRYVPEPLNFAVQLLQSAAPLRKNAPSQPQTFFSASDPSARWLALGHGGGKESNTAEIKPLEMASVLAKAADDGYFESLEFKASALAAAMGIVQRAVEVFGGIAALPEALGPAQTALEDLGRAKGLPKALEKRQVEVLKAVRQVRTHAVASRRPLVRRNATKNPEFKLFNPRFEEDFVAGKNYDPDRERAEQKKLKRQVQKEKRGAMRELRKDAVFLGAAREADAAAEKKERRKNLRANFAFLESQEADFKSGGQGGLWKKGGNKKAGNK